ncbi:nucleotide exchange factor GrpE [Wansuia hejianensis]|uniref:Protein GrpE n=1 Tax=Wansuia hejianensis TaxID=2763667 RepID=A0A926F2K4_9FIRM|nr:nucleotide exchange factor GrpE [Wansuia hejianensis]MBC8590779.1 nucleotide exchange factor GrpE [Wansuia hejianensis]
MEVDKNLKSPESNEELEKENHDYNTKDSQTEELLKKKEAELKEVDSQLLRLQADFVNYKKRTEKEKEGLISYGVETIACELLPILDNFERALESQDDKEDGFYKGIDMIKQQLFDTLKNNGLEEIDALNKPFDPNYHHAVVMEESQEHEEGTIIGVLQKGYMIKDKVIRPAMVIVCK